MPRSTSPTSVRPGPSGSIGPSTAIRFQLGGQPYDRGLGTQSRTLLAYRLKPGDRRFQALVGVDDRAGPLGSVVFRVLVDGKSRFTTPPMSARDTPGRSTSTSRRQSS